MPDAVESRSFRAAARKNCIKYLDIPIYVTNIPEMQKLALPTFKTQNPSGAVSQLFSTLVNMNTQIEQIRKSLRMSDSKPVPGVNYDEISSMSMSLSGDVYFEDAKQYAAFISNVSSIAKEYGWRQSVSTATACAVYHPAKNSFSNSDPAQAAIKGMVMHSFSDVGDALTIASTNKDVEAGSAAEKAYFAARDRYLGGSVFNTAAIQYYSNSPMTIQNRWAGMGAKASPTLIVDGEPVLHANISYMPSNMSITPGAFVVDKSGFYPTKCTISIQMENPLGGLLANFSNEEDGVAQDSSTTLETVPSNYLSIAQKLGATKTSW
ncbi:MAG: hypothetical protein HUK12_06255 [Muribaculaceae bacterium]|nr:hypothetical protein [Muribaculaceae bacterium]